MQQAGRRKALADIHRLPPICVRVPPPPQPAGVNSYFLPEYHRRPED